VPCVDDVIVESVSLSTSPGVADNMRGLGTIWGLSVGESWASHPLSARDESSVGTTSLSVQSLAGNPLGSWSNTDSVTANDGSHGVSSVTIVVSGGLSSSKSDVSPSVISSTEVSG